MKPVPTITQKGVAYGEVQGVHVAEALYVEVSALAGLVGHMQAEA